MLFPLSYLRRAADGAQEVEEAVGLVELVGEQLPEGFLRLLDEIFVLSYLALAVLTGSHAQEFAETIVDSAVKIVTIASLL